MTFWLFVTGALASMVCFLDLRLSIFASLVFGYFMVIFLLLVISTMFKSLTSLLKSISKDARFESLDPTLLISRVFIWYICLYFFWSGITKYIRKSNRHHQQTIGYDGRILFQRRDRSHGGIWRYIPYIAHNQNPRL